MKLIVPSLASDLDVLLNNKEHVLKYLHVESIVVIGNEDVGKLLDGECGIEFIDEKTVCDFGIVYEAIGRRNDAAKGRAGWYYQQFLKMAYAYKSEDEYYLLWDSDTVPVREQTFFDGPKSFLDLKTEYHKAYFDTIGVLFPSIKKMIRGSFISEHMMIKTEHMREMIDDISKSPCNGNSWIEKIINSIPERELAKSGFSEYETYGNYVTCKYRNEYLNRKWHSLRFGELFFEKGRRMNDADMEWLGKYYDAISFEKFYGTSFGNALVSTSWFKKLITPAILEVLSLAIRVKRKIHKYEYKITQSRIKAD